MPILLNPSHHAHMAVWQLGNGIKLCDRPMIPSREEALDGRAVGDDDDVLGACLTLEPAIERIKEERDTIRDVGARFAIREAIEEVTELLAELAIRVILVRWRHIAVFLFT